MTDTSVDRIAARMNAALDNTVVVTYESALRLVKQSETVAEAEMRLQAAIDLYKQSQETSDNGR